MAQSASSMADVLPAKDDLPGPIEARQIRILGTVQGVGFRPWLRRRAEGLGLRGWVRNEGTDAVLAEASGPAEALDALVEAITHEAPPAARVDQVVWERTRARHGDGFRVISSCKRDSGEGLALVPDLATCAHCLVDLQESGERRRGYAFTSCCACGPRFTMVEALPYDRQRTTMRRYPLCPECAREYGDPEDRRFHAESTACPCCGPMLFFLAPDGTRLESGEQALDAGVRALENGAIVAIKGIGGFHLACDATREETVAKLRARKGRPSKPLAVMVADMTVANTLARIHSGDRALLAGSDSPIVLVPKREPSLLAPGVAPDTTDIGLILPYAPLHHLLLRAISRPLLMTSANRSGEPIAFEDDAALESLGPFCDGFLTHDRPIAAPCDDSVVRTIAGAPTLLRRSRGHVPRPIALPRPVERPVLGCGAHFNNTFCIAVGDRAYLSAHQGDLDTLDGIERYADSIRHLEELLGVRPEVVAHDLHPLYGSTAYARERDALLRVGVQHHHAHVAAAMAEHGLSGSVLGVAFDGTGYGPDGASWGGEFLEAEPERFSRRATLRSLPLVGGDAAVREPWRVALAALEDAFDGAPPLDRLAVFGQVPSERRRSVRALLAAGTGCTPAHGLGRYFDAAAAIVLARSENQHQGHLASLWGGLADGCSGPAYPYLLDTDADPWTIDLRPMFRALVQDHLSGTEPAHISGRFHLTIAAVTCEVLRHLEAQTGPRPIVLTGGCFQNSLLVERILSLWDGRGEMLVHRRVPSGDSGISLGQVLVADARVRSGDPTPCA